MMMAAAEANTDRMRKPWLSIIVPVYQAEAFISRCIESILQQTFSDFELILIDDGSTDQSFAICQSFAASDTRIGVYQLPANQGQAAARNVGLDVANGQYIGFVDADDWVESTMYEKLFSMIQQQTADIACCGTRCIKQNGDYFYYSPPSDQVHVVNRQQALELLLDNLLITSSPTDKLFKTSVFAGIRFIPGMAYEDYDKMAVLIARADQVVYTSQPLYNYFYSENSTTRSNASLKSFDEYQASLNRTRFYRTHFTELKQKAERIHLTKVLSIIYRTTEGDEAVRKKRKELIRSVRKSFIKNVQVSFKQKSLLVKVCVLQLNSFLYVQLMDVYYKKKQEKLWLHEEAIGGDQ